MNSKRVSYLMMAGLAVLVLAILGSAYFANGLFEKQSARLMELKLKSQVLDEEQTSLIKAKRDIERYKALDTIAKTIVPRDKDQAQTVREIIKLAAESGITPSSITFPQSTLGNSATGATTAPAAGSSSTTPRMSDAQTKLTQLTPVVGNKGLYVLQITINQDPAAAVSYDKFIAFLERLENNRRTAQVSNIVIKPSPTDRNLLSFTLTVDEFIKP